MGKGDRRTFRGKIAKRSYGNARSHSVKPKVAAAAAPVAKTATRKKA